MAAVAAIAAVAGGAVAVQANQQKIAAQKQRDAVGDAQKAQEDMLKQQQVADQERKDKEAAATAQAFTVAAASRRSVSGASLPGAAPDSSIGNPGNAAGAAKSLIGG